MVRRHSANAETPAYEAPSRRYATLAAAPAAPFSASCQQHVKTPPEQ
jgi:hypothetical protein